MDVLVHAYSSALFDFPTFLYPQYRENSETIGEAMFKIVTKRDLNKDVSYFEIEAPKIAKKHKAGQFIVLRIDETGERTPVTIAGTDVPKGTITIIVQGIGKTTKRLNSLKQGDALMDVVGPLGQATHIEKFGTAVVMGGGVGIAEALPLAKAIKEAGNRTHAIIGARNKDLLIMENEMRAASDALHVTTDDGSYARKGFVTDVLKELMAAEPIHFVLAVGPVPMMRAVVETTRPSGIKTMVSLNPIMVDGTGMCGVCRVTVGGRTRFACVDGPEFDGHEVDFDELVKRQRQYLRQEKESLDLFLKDHECRIGL